MNLPPADLQRLLAEESFVRALASSLLADEADDVVQEVYLRALEQRPEPVRAPRSWLARLVHNLATDQRRRRQRRFRREQAVATSAMVPSSAELLMAEERRRELVVAVDALPESLRTVVLLRWFEGLPPRRIARDLGLQVATVWSRLHQALVALRQHLDAAHDGERRAWLLPLVPFAVSPRALPWQETAGTAATVLPVATGMLIMTTKTKALGVVAALLVVASVWSLLPPVTSVPVPEGLRTGAEPVVGSLPEANLTVDVQRTGALADVGSGAVPATATIGDLEVKVSYVDAPTTAAAVIVVALAVGSDFRMDSLHAITDADGVARFTGLAPGVFRILTPAHAGRAAKAEVVAGHVAKAELLLQRGYRLNGVVVDAAGVAVGGAIIEMVAMGERSAGPEQVAIAASDGTFTLRQARLLQLVGARAAGHSASQLHFIQAEEGTEHQLRIELPTTGGSVEGVVVDDGGKPLVGAVVLVGDGRTEAIRATRQGAPPLPAQVRTDAEGHFLAVGVPAGAQMVQARAGDRAPWLGSVEVLPGATTSVRVILSAGVRCRGMVRNEAGEPQAGVEVRVGKPGDFVQMETRTAADGWFVLHGLPADEVEIVANQDEIGRATSRVHGRAGEEVTCELVLSAGLVLRGRAVDGAGVPLRDVRVSCRATGVAWEAWAVADQEGRFVVTQCPPGRLLTVEASLPDYSVWQRADVDPSAGVLAVQLVADTAPPARIVGRLLRADGTGAVGVEVEVHRLRPHHSRDVKISDAGGRFVLEVPAASWNLRVLTADHPEIRREGRVLTPGETWDVGTLQLVRGGTLVVQHPPKPELDYLVVAEDGSFVSGLSTPLPPLRSPLLAPGHYRLLARAPEVSAIAMPFTIRPDAETTLEVRPAPGVHQAVEFVVRTGIERPTWLAYMVRRQGEVVMIGSSNGSGDALTAEMWLAPGSYELVTREREPVTTVPFRVLEQPGPRLCIELR